MIKKGGFTLTQSKTLDKLEWLKPLQTIRRNLQIKVVVINQEAATRVVNSAPTIEIRPGVLASSGKNLKVLFRAFQPHHYIQNLKGRISILGALFIIMAFMILNHVKDHVQTLLNV